MEENIESPFVVEGGDPSSPVNEDIDPLVREVNFAIIGNGGLESDNLEKGYDDDTNKNIWLVLHGWNSDYDNFVPLAETVAKAKPEDIVLLLDWVEVSHTEAGGQRGGNFIAASWIRPLAEAIYNKLEDWGFTSGDRLNLIGHSLGTLLSSEIAKQYEQVNSIFALDPPSELNKIVNLNEFSNGYDLDFREDGYNDLEDTLTPFREVAEYSLGLNGDPSAAGNEDFSSFAHESILMNFGKSVDFGQAHGMVLEVFQNLIDPDRGSIANDILSLDHQNQNWQLDSITDKHEAVISVDEPEGEPENQTNGWQSEELPDPNYLLAIDAESSVIIAYGTDQDDTIDGNELLTPFSDTDDLSIQIEGDRGNDLLINSEVTEEEFVQENTLTGGNGDDTLIGNQQEDQLFGNKGNDQLEGKEGSDYLDGGIGKDLILGGDGEDQLIGKDDSDTLNGGDGADILLGGYGDDLYIVDSLQDFTLNEKPDGGDDTIESSVNWALGPNSKNIENIILTGDRFTSGVGNLLNNQITGSDAKNRLSGGRGNDILDGKRREDRLLGNGGDDTLIGGFADDLLSGGEGEDIFQFDSIRHGVDTIVDFTPDDDLISISSRGFLGGLDTGFLSEENFLILSNGESLDSDYSLGFVYSTEDGSLGYIDRENQIDLTEIAILSGIPTLEAVNIQIIA